MIFPFLQKGFEPRHVRALCMVGQSSKGVGGTGYIGQKGIGFKSVFRVSSRPEIHSNGFEFSLDEVPYLPLGQLSCHTSYLHLPNPYAYAYI